MNPSAYIPNQVRNDSAGLSAQNVRLICFGLQRSGTTWIWQVCGDALGDGVIKTHEWLDLQVPVLSVYRDPRDCVISHWRFRHPDEVERLGVIPRERLYWIAGRYLNTLWRMQQYQETHLPLHLRYETAIEKPQQIFSLLSALTGWEVTPQRQAEILAARHIDRNREICAALQPGESRDVLEPGHVHEGQPGTWRRFVDPASSDLLNRLLQPWLERLNYADK